MNWLISGKYKAFIRSFYSSNGTETTIKLGPKTEEQIAGHCMAWWIYLYDICVGMVDIFIWYMCWDAEQSPLKWCWSLIVGRVRQKGTSCIFATLPLLVEDVFIVMRPVNRNDHNDYRQVPSFCRSPNENMTRDDYELGMGNRWLYHHSLAKLFYIARTWSKLMNQHLWLEFWTLHLCVCYLYEFDFIIDNKKIIETFSSETKFGKWIP